MAHVEIKKEEPRIAPIPISEPIDISPPVTYTPIIATKGTMVSGSAVPMAAKIEPVALVPIFKEQPKFSIAFVKMLHVSTTRNKRNKIKTKCKAISILYSLKPYFVISYKV